jgi:hypothetical protein
LYFLSRFYYHIGVPGIEEPDGGGRPGGTPGEGFPDDSESQIQNKNGMRNGGKVTFAMAGTLVIIGVGLFRRRRRRRLALAAAGGGSGDEELSAMASASGLESTDAARNSTVARRETV